MISGRNVIAQPVVILGVAEEVSLVGGDRVEKQRHLAAAGGRGQEGIVLRKALDPGRPQPPAHAIAHHHPLVVGDPDAGDAIDQLAEFLVFLVSELERGS